MEMYRKTYRLKLFSDYNSNIQYSLRKIKTNKTLAPENMNTKFKAKQK